MTFTGLSLPGRGRRPVTAYIKPSDYCNVGCAHCYLPKAVRANRDRMSDETLDQAIATIRDMVEAQRAPGALVIWHGGEPLALPPAYLRAACARVAERMPDAIQGIQTSLIPYRSEWAPLVHDYFDGTIGSSIDFSLRSIKGSLERYQDLWLEKVALARTDGCDVIPGTVPSVSEVGRGAEIVAWMAEHGFSRWNIDRYNSFQGDDLKRPRNVDHSLFLTEVFDAVLDQARKGVFMRVNTVTAALGGVLFNTPGDRWGGTCSKDFIVINPDGSTNACPDKISFENFSDISSGYDGFSRSEIRRDWVRLHLAGHRNSHCARCRWRGFCRSGCPLTPNSPESEGECSGYARHLDHVHAACQEEPDLVRRYLEEVSR